MRLPRRRFAVFKLRWVSLVVKHACSLLTGSWFHKCLHAPHRRVESSLISHVMRMRVHCYTSAWRCGGISCVKRGRQSLPASCATCTRVPQARRRCWTCVRYRRTNCPCYGAAALTSSYIGWRSKSNLSSPTCSCVNAFKPQSHEPLYQDCLQAQTCKGLTQAACARSLRTKTSTTECELSCRQAGGSSSSRHLQQSAHRGTPCQTQLPLQRPNALLLTPCSNPRPRRWRRPWHPQCCTRRTF